MILVLAIAVAKTLLIKGVSRVRHRHDTWLHWIMSLSQNLVVSTCQCIIASNY